MAQIGKSKCSLVPQICAFFSYKADPQRWGYPERLWAPLIKRFRRLVFWFLKYVTIASLTSVSFLKYIKKVKVRRKSSIRYFVTHSGEAERP